MSDRELAEVNAIASARYYASTYGTDWKDYCKRYNYYINFYLQPPFFYPNSSPIHQAIKDYCEG